MTESAELLFLESFSSVVSRGKSWQICIVYVYKSSLEEGILSGEAYQVWNLQC